MSEQKGKRKGGEPVLNGISAFHLNRENDVNSQSLRATPTNPKYCKTTLIFLVLTGSCHLFPVLFILFGDVIMKGVVGHKVTN